MRNRIARRLQGFLDLVTLASAYNLATGANYENLGNDKRLSGELPRCVDLMTYSSTIRYSFLGVITATVLWVLMQRFPTISLNWR